MLVKDIEKVIIIGAGGTGSMLIVPLVRYLRSQNYKGKIIIADGDAYSESNATRQMFNLSKVGTNKAEYQAMVIASQLPDIGDQVEFINTYLSQENIADIFEDHCVVFNCVDNNAVRKYVEDRLEQLKTACHICCGNELVNGQVQISLRSDGTRITPSIYNQVPAFNTDNGDRSKMDCHAIAELPSGGQVIAANMMAAAFALNYFIQLAGNFDYNLGGKFIRHGTMFFDIVNHNIEGKDSKVPDINALAEHKKKHKNAKIRN